MNNERFEDRYENWVIDAPVTAALIGWLASFFVTEVKGFAVLMTLIGVLLTFRFVTSFPVRPNAYNVAWYQDYVVGFWVRKALYFLAILTAAYAVWAGFMLDSRQSWVSWAHLVLIVLRVAAELKWEGTPIPPPDEDEDY